MSHFRHLSMFVLILLLNSSLGPVLGQEAKVSKEQLNPQITGMWRVEPERTDQANAESRKEMSPEMIEVLNSMTLHLNDDGQFRQTMGPQRKITGQWKFKFSESGGERKANSKGQLTLIPDNLEGHADMQFDIEFLSPDLIKADPPQGLGIVFLERHLEAVDNAEPIAADGQQEQETDRGRRGICKCPRLPGCALA